MGTASSTKPARLTSVLAAVVGLIVGLSIARLYESYSPTPGPVPVKETQVKFDASTRKGTVTAVVVRDSPGESFGYLLQAIQATCPNPPVALTSISPLREGSQNFSPGTMISIDFECR